MKLFEYFLRGEWNLYIGRGSYPDCCKKAHAIRVKTIDRSSWYADPFILKVTKDVITLLVEEYDKKVKRGILTITDIDINTHKEISKKPLLNKEYHLSYPYIFSEHGKIYIIPESSQGNVLNLYKYSEAERSLIFIDTLLNEPMVDTGIIYINGFYYLIGTKKPKATTELVIYRSKEIRGTYSLFQIIELKRGFARGAGSIFTSNKALIRPIQDCSNGYGRGIVFSKMHFSGNNFSIELEKIRILYPNKLKHYGIHTYNEKDNIYVYDCKVYNLPFIATIGNYVIDILRKWKR